MSLDSRLFKPICSYSSSASLALVRAEVSRLSTAMSIVVPDLLLLLVLDHNCSADSGALSGTEFLGKGRQNRLHYTLYLGLSEGRILAVER